MHSIGLLLTCAALAGRSASSLELANEGYSQRGPDQESASTLFGLLSADSRQSEWAFGSWSQLLLPLAAVSAVVAIQAFGVYWTRVHEEANGEEQEPLPPENKTALMWANVATFFSNLDFSVALPAAISQQDGSSSLTVSGLWVGLWGLGAICALSFYYRIPIEHSRKMFKIHAFCICLGNVGTICGQAQDWQWLTMLGRFVSGMNGPTRFAADKLMLHLTAKGKQRSIALLDNRLYTALGTAFGFVLQQLLRAAAVLLRVDWILPGWLQPGRASLASAMIALYGVAALFGLSFTFSSELTQFQPERPPARTCKEASQYKAIKAIGLTVFCQLTRTLTSQILRSGLAIILTLEYGYDGITDWVLLVNQLSLIQSRRMVKNLTSQVSNVASLMRCIEMVELLTIPLLFRIGSPTSTWCFLFLVDSAFFFNANAVQSGINVSFGSENTLPGHWLLNNHALAAYVFMAHMSTYFTGPLIAFAMMDWRQDQNLLASLLALLNVVQVATTYAWIQSNEPRAEAMLKGSERPNNREAKPNADLGLKVSGG